MGAGTQALAFLLQVVFGLAVFLFIVRFLMRATFVDWRLPLVHMVARLTNWACAPLGRIIPTRGRWDLAALAAAFLIEMVYVLLIGAVTGRSFGVGVVFIALAETLNVLLDTLFWLVIIAVILSWIQPGYNPNLAIFQQMAEPILRPFQRLIPPIGGLDLSPIVAIVAIKLAQILLVGPLAGFAQGFVPPMGM